MPIIAVQATPSLQKEGLPYWTFWFMLLIIALLFVFIFLRDRKLRLRLIAFFAGARKRSVLLQLRFRLKRERQKKENFLKRLGEKAWDADIRIRGAENIRASLGALVKRRDADQMEAKNALTELERLHQRMEEAKAQFGEKLNGLGAEKLPLDERLKKIKDEMKTLKKLGPQAENEGRADSLEEEAKHMVREIDQLDRSIKDLEEEAKDRYQDIAREIHHWEKARARAQGRIKEIEAHQEDLYISFGRVLEKKKVDNADLRELYAEIDQVNQRISTLKHRMETLSGV